MWSSLSYYFVLPTLLFATLKTNLSFISFSFFFFSNEKTVDLSVAVSLGRRFCDFWLVYFPDPLWPRTRLSVRVLKFYSYFYSYSYSYSYCWSYSYCLFSSFFFLTSSADISVDLLYRLTTFYLCYALHRRVLVFVRLNLTHTSDSRGFALPKSEG